MENEILAKKIKELITKISSEIKFSLEEKKLSSSEYNLLKIVIDNHSNDLPLNMSKTSKILNVSRPALTQAMHKMGFKGYIKKYCLKGDRKNVYLKPTAKGMKLFTKVDEEYLLVFKDLVKTIGCEDSEKIIEIMDKFLQVKKVKGENQNA